jgi:plasmid stabilization system protein ParE
VKRRYVLAPQAARDLVEIWRYVKQESSRETADRVESVIRGKFVYLAEFPGGGHWRRDLTEAPVRFFSVYSYLIVYRPEPNRYKSSPSCTVAGTWQRFCRSVSDGSFTNQAGAVR